MQIGMKRQTLQWRTTKHAAEKKVVSLSCPRVSFDTLYLLLEKSAGKVIAKRER